MNTQITRQSGKIVARAEKIAQNGKKKRSQKQSRRGCPTDWFSLSCFLYQCSSLTEHALHWAIMEPAVRYADWQKMNSQTNRQRCADSGRERSVYSDPEQKKMDCRKKVFVKRTTYCKTGFDIVMVESEQEKQRLITELLVLFTGWCVRGKHDRSAGKRMGKKRRFRGKDGGAKRGKKKNIATILYALRSAAVSLCSIHETD